MFAAIGSSARILPELLTDLTGPLGDRVRSRLHGYSIIDQLVMSPRENRDIYMGEIKGSDDRHRPCVLAGLGPRHR